MATGGGDRGAFVGSKKTDQYRNFLDCAVDRAKDTIKDGTFGFDQCVRSNHVEHFCSDPNKSYLLQCFDIEKVVKEVVKNPKAAWLRNVTGDRHQRLHLDGVFNQNIAVSQERPPAVGATTGIRERCNLCRVILGQPARGDKKITCLSVQFFALSENHEIYVNIFLSLKNIHATFS